MNQCADVKSKNSQFSTKPFYMSVKSSSLTLIHCSQDATDAELQDSTLDCIFYSHIQHCLSAADTDADSGIGSPFGVGGGKLSSTSSASDWMDHKHHGGKAGSSSSSSSPYPLSPYRVTFDMSALKISENSSNCE